MENWTIRTARALAKKLRGLHPKGALKGDDLPTEVKITDVWKLFISRVATAPQHGVVNTRSAIHENRSPYEKLERTKEDSDKDLQDMSGGDEECESSADSSGRRNLARQYSNFLQNKFFPKDCVYPVYRDERNLVFCIPSMGKTSAGNLE